MGVECEKDELKYQVCSIERFEEKLVWVVGGLWKGESWFLRPHWSVKASEGNHKTKVKVKRVDYA